MWIYPYKVGSASVRGLRETLRAKTIRLRGSKFKGRAGKRVVNWGNSSHNGEVLKCNLLNHPVNIRLASNKLAFFQAVKDKVNIPSFTLDKEEARTYLGRGVIVRETLTGHSGQGIVFLKNEEEFEEYDHERSKLYVAYIPKKEEYRVHILKGQVLDVQRKAARLGQEDVNWKVRNHKNGFVFVRNGFETPDEVVEQAFKAIVHTGLDFGAVDVIYNVKEEKAYVLEVNTAPGLEGTTLENYSKAFHKEQTWQELA